MGEAHRLHAQSIAKLKITPKSPNRMVGDLSLQPTRKEPRALPNPPTGRLGIFHFSLTRKEPRDALTSSRLGWSEVSFWVGVLQTLDLSS